MHPPYVERKMSVLVQDAVLSGFWGVRDEGLGFKVQGLGFRVDRVEGFKALGLWGVKGFRESGCWGFRGLRLQGSRVLGFEGFRVEGSRVLGFQREFRV